MRRQECLKKRCPAAEWIFSKQNTIRLLNRVAKRRCWFHMPTINFTSRDHCLCWTFNVETTMLVGRRVLSARDVCHVQPLSWGLVQIGIHSGYCGYCGYSVVTDHLLVVYRISLGETSQQFHKHLGLGLCRPEPRRSEYRPNRPKSTQSSPRIFNIGVLWACR